MPAQSIILPLLLHTDDQAVIAVLMNASWQMSQLIMNPLIAYMHANILFSTPFCFIFNESSQL